MITTAVKPSVAIVVLFYMSRCWIRDRNGELSLCKRKPQEAESACQHHIQFTIKDYLQPLAKLIETHTEENYPYLRDCRCGVLRKWQIRSRVHSSIDRNLSQAMSELERLSGKLYISPSLKEKAALIYRKALDKGLVRGRSINSIASAALYAACRQSGTPRTLRDIADASLVDRKDVARCYRLLLQELHFAMPLPTH